MGHDDGRLSSLRVVGAPASRLGFFILIVLATLALQFETLLSIIELWSNVGSFGHGFLIVPIVLVLCWKRRLGLSRLQAEASIYGLGVILFGSSLGLLGEAANVQVVRQFALVIVVQGLILAVFGVRVTRHLLFPLFFLYFAVPFGEFAVPYLQGLTAEIVVRLVRLLGVPVYHDNVLIYLPNSSFEVAAACAGLRYLISTIVLGSLAANLFFQSMKRRALFLAICIIVPVLANGFRAFSVVILVYISDSRYGVEHNTFSLVMMGGITLGLVLAAIRFREVPQNQRIEPDKLSSVARRRRARLSTIGLGTVLIIGAAHSYADVVLAQEDATHLIRPTLPERVNGWKAINTSSSWTTRTSQPFWEGQRSYIKDGRKVDLNVAVYTGTQKEGEIIGYTNAFFDNKIWRPVADRRSAVNVGGQEIDISALQILSASEGRIVWYWYFVDDKRTTSPYIVKALQAKQRLFRSSGYASVVAISAPYYLDPNESRDALGDFISGLPSIDGLIYYKTTKVEVGPDK